MHSPKPPPSPGSSDRLPDAPEDPTLPIEAPSAAPDDRALTTEELYEERRRALEAAERSRQRLAFLAEASTVLSSSLEYATTLEHVARLTVPHLADWCTVHQQDADGTVRQVVVAHRDLEKVRWAHAMHERYPYDPTARRGVANVLRTGQTEVYPEVTDALLVAAARNAEHLDLVRRLGLRSCMLVPLAIRDRVFGVISFYATESGQRYGPDDVVVAEDLANRIAMAIENARLYREAGEALAALREADRRKDEFLAMLGHELRNPMGAIRNAVEVIGRLESVEPRLTRAAGIVRRQCHQLARLVEDLLDVSRIRRGQLLLSRERLDLSNLVRLAAEDRGGRDGPRLVVHVPPEPVPVDGDAARLTQVVANLLHNAQKFTDPDGEVSLSLSRDGPWAVITVRDTGIGIPPELLPQLFDPFAQVEEIRARSLGGLGLGLPLVKGILTLHGGDIRAESQGRGHGATFHVRLPLAR